MNRLGFKPTDASLAEIENISKLPNTNITGIFSHFADAEENPEFTKNQFSKFIDFTEIRS